MSLPGRIPDDLVTGAPGAGSDTGAPFELKSGVVPTNLRDESPDPRIGTTIDGRYVVEGVLGQGGMGVVYRGRHKLIDRRVALKVLKSEMAKDHEILERFIQEAKTASAIGNAHIVDIFDFGTLEDGCTYIAMEYLDGVSLTQIINGRPGANRIARIAVQVCEGLGAAHAAGIVHRDLKPDNIFVLHRADSRRQPSSEDENDFVKILDFGIAKVSGDASQKLTRAGAVFGTPHYMSPEQASGTTVDHRADIYALGVILYEMAAGQLPFDADNFMGILTQHMYRAPVPIRALINDTTCPPGLEAIVQKCLEKRAGQRYQTMEQLAGDLRRFLAGDVPQAVAELMGQSARYDGSVDFYQQSGVSAPAGAPQPVHPATSPSKSSGPPWLAVALVALIGGGLAGGAYLYMKRRAVASAPASTTIAAQAEAPAQSTPETALSPVVAPTPSATLASSSDVKKDLVTVELRSAVKDAVVLDDAEQKPLPAKVSLERGKKRTLVVRAEGYDDAVVDLDGSKPAVDVTLKKSLKGVVGTPRPPTQAGPRTTTLPNLPTTTATVQPPPTTKPTTKPDDDGPVQIFKR